MPVGMRLYFASLRELRASAWHQQRVWGCFSPTAQLMKSRADSFINDVRLDSERKALLGTCDQQLACVTPSLTGDAS